MSARAQILGGIRYGLQRDELSGDARQTAESRLADPKPNLIPQRAQLPHAEQVALFVRMVEALSATTAEVATEREVPAAIADYLAQNNLAPEFRMAPDAWLQSLPWFERPMLSFQKGRAEPSDMVSVTPAFAAVAETGTLVLTSGAETPTTLNFLPDNHIAVLKKSEIVGDYESVWRRLRQKFGPGQMPRTVNMITGPSRTADIEQQVILGAHGPRRLHIVLVDDGQG